MLYYSQTFKKEWCNMRYGVWGFAGMVMVLAMVACSGDNGSSVESEELASHKQVVVDEQHKAIIYHEEPYSMEGCVLDKGSFGWKEYQFQGTVADTTYYEMHGDTLVVFFYGNREDPHYYLGGTPENIFGEWTNIECFLYDGVVYCHDEADRKFRQTYSSAVLTISENEFQENIVYKPAYSKNEDYTNSSYMIELYDFLKESRHTPPVVLSSLFNPQEASRMDAYEKENGVNVLEKTKTSAKFELGGKTYDFKVTKVERDSVYYEVAVSVSSGEMSCSFSEETVKLTEESCKDLTVDVIPFYDQERDAKEIFFLGSQGTPVKKGGDEEKFVSCLKSIALGDKE